MDRCPNCGSSVRVGAKFCTTCGFRLPVQPPPQSEHAHARSPFDTTSTSYVSSRWPTAGTPADPPEPVAAVEPLDPAPEEPTAEVIYEPASAEPSVEAIPDSSEPLPFTGWPAFGSGTDKLSEWSGGIASEASEPVATVDDSGEIKSVEEAVFAWSGSSSSEDESAGSHDIAEASEPDEQIQTPDDSESESWIAAIESESEEPAASVDEALIVAEGELPLAGEIDESDGLEAVASLDDEFDSPELADLAELDGAPVPAEATGSAGSGMDAASYLAEDSPVERAKRLVTELNELMPLLTGARVSEPSVSSEVAGALEASRADGDTDATAFQSLRAAVATAQARPRDVDVMLDLISRADAIAAVLKAHDRYAAAIDVAVSELRREKKAGPEPRW